jgi:Tol biopolymer transport system component
LFQLAWLDLDGNIEPVGEEHALLLFPAFSPDERRVALSGYSEDELDVWIHDLSSGQRRRLTNDPSRELVAGWSPDGSRICVVDTTRMVTRMISAEDGQQVGDTIDGFVWSLNSDWSACALGRQSETTGPDIWAFWPAGQRQAQPIVQTEAYEGFARISPDGQWLAYESDLTGVYEVYLTRFPGGEGRRQVTATGGRMPIWAPGGDVLYYVVRESDFMAVDVTTEPDLQIGAARELKLPPQSGVATSMGGRFTADGKRMLAVRSASAARGERSIVLVENWFDELDAARE